MVQQTATGATQKPPPPPPPPPSNPNIQVAQTVTPIATTISPIPPPPPSAPSAPVLPMNTIPDSKPATIAQAHTTPPMSTATMPDTDRQTPTALSQPMPTYTNQVQTDTLQPQPEPKPGHVYTTPHHAYTTPHNFQQPVAVHPPYTMTPTISQSIMQQQMATFQQTMLDQNQRQMELMQKQFQMTLESSLKVISETVSKTMATVQPQRQPSPIPYPPEIQYVKSTQDTVDVQDFHSATSVPNLADTASEYSSQKERTDQSTTSTSSRNDMMEFVAALREPKLSFPILKQSTDFLTWRAMCALKCAKSTKHNSLAIISTSGGYEFNMDMTVEQSSTLFMLVYDALGTISDKIIVDVTNPDGIFLLKQLELYFIDVDTSVVNQQVLQQEFDSMKRNQNENYHQFALRFTKKMKELELNKVEIPRDEAALAYRFLRGLNEQRINTEICLELSSKTDWYKGMTLIETANKAQRYMRQFNQLYNTSKPSNQRQNSTKPEQEKKGPDANSKSTSSNKDSEAPQKGSHEGRVKVMEGYLAGANDVEAYL